jgi:hypothetical protein
MSDFVERPISGSGNVSYGSRIAVGMPITEPPPRTDPGVPNSGTGLLPRVFDGETPIRPRMKDSRGRKPGIGDSSHSLPRHGVLLTAPPERAPP